jgi:hypothetical protein
MGVFYYIVEITLEEKLWLWRTMKSQNTRAISQKFDPVRFIIAIVLVGVIMIVAMNFLAPTIGNVFPTGAG